VAARTRPLHADAAALPSLAVASGAGNAAFSLAFRAGACCFLFCHGCLSLFSPSQGEDILVDFHLIEN
jgi:hypothetical protein